MAHLERIEVNVAYHVGKSNRNSKTFLYIFSIHSGKPEPPLEKDIQFHCTDTPHCYKVHKIHSYCDDEENQKAELLRHMTAHGNQSTILLTLRCTYEYNNRRAADGVAILQSKYLANNHFAHLHVGHHFY
ncbi:conserved hypothetical protein [Trichinella spiralis]|uniref:hypothetical protein n=1 Tax=Trichinella spiralis TaxID=6334 RepID=UPI0001EFC1F9|nr:conserved hypothetical protein [Trichinella spiralis]